MYKKYFCVISITKMFYFNCYVFFTLVYIIKYIQPVHYFSFNSVKSISKNKDIFHNKKTELKNKCIDLDLDLASSNSTDNKTLISIQTKNNYSGFDLSKNISFVAEQDELQKITNYFHKLKQLTFLESPFVSDIIKLKYAEEILKEITDNKNITKNNFWETFEDMFF